MGSITKALAKNGLLEFDDHSPPPRPSAQAAADNLIADLAGTKDEKAKLRLIRRAFRVFNANMALWWEDGDDRG